MNLDEAKNIIREYIDNLESAVEKERHAVWQLNQSYEHFFSLSLRLTTDEKMQKEHKRSSYDCLFMADSHSKNIQKLELRLEALKTLLSLEIKKI